MSGQGTYRLIRKIADGGMAEIFLAEAQGAQGFRRQVVLKRVRQALFADPTFRNMLIDEAHIAMGLNHGNVVPVLGIGEAAGRYFLALELVDGWSLDEVLRRARRANVELPRALSLFIVAQICRALGYAHAFSRDGQPLQIVHRDISPQNILLSEQGEVKLADFGIARALSKTENTAPGVVKGKVKYMSPEQTQGVALDRRSDLFSLGIVLYQLVVGKLPFAGASDLETMTAISGARFTPAQDALPGLEGPVAEVLQKAMQRLPDARYADADEMLAAVEKALRAAFPPTGQSELKAWLANLATLDGALPISRVPVSEIDQAEVGADAAIELNDSDVVSASQPRVPPPQPRASAPRAPFGPTPLPAPPEKRRALWPWVVLLALGAVVWRWDAVGRALPRLLGAPEPVERVRPPPTLAEVLPPLPGPPAPEVGWTAFPDAADAAVELDAGALALDAGAALAAGGADGGAEIEDVDEAQLLSEVELDAGTLEEGDPEPLDAGAAQPALAPTVMVRIITQPPGAVVRLKRRVFGQTPITLRFRSGIVFELEFVKSGYLPATKRFLVTEKAGQAVWVPLKKAPVKKKSPGR
jgi:eukaryotic-like serine/threonine-protein kinase